MQANELTIGAKVTGVVTGTHLHYEVWYDGERTDAELYYPNLESVFVRAYNGE